jgi:hypothetical protein
MKNLIFIFVLLASIAIHGITNAQSPIDKVFDKYSGQDRFTTVNISKEMFQMFLQMIGDEKTDSNAVEMKKMMEQLTGLKVLTYNIDSANMVKAVSVYNEFSGLFPPSSYKELMTVSEGRENYKFLTKQSSGGNVSEMVMLMKGKNEVIVLSVTGIIDLSTISKLSKSVNIKGMENLKKMKDSHNQKK